MMQVFVPAGDVPDERAVAQLAACLADERAVAGALMADHHLGYSMPIGGVVAYQDAISPTGVGFDIACGNKAARTGILVSELGDVKPVMREIQKRIEFGVGRRNPTPVDDVLFDDEAWPWIEQASPGLREKAVAQLGTVGSGNHYVDLLADENDHVWVACHFGSRGLGHTLASGFLALAAGAKFNDRVPESDDPVVFDTDTAIGQAYLVAMALAGRYAYAGRNFVIDEVLRILDIGSLEEVHCHHNYAWLEDGRWVVRKGATPLTREPAFIGGSMGAGAAVVRGAAVAEFEGDVLIADVGALGSAPHGAGRVMSRTAAAGKLRKMWSCSNRECGYALRAEPGREGPVGPCPDCGGIRFRKVRARDASTALIDWDAARADLTERGIVVLGAGADESPGVYKDLDAVLAAHENIEILHRLRPLGVVMAGADTFDPYKD